MASRKPKFDSLDSTEVPLHARGAKLYALLAPAGADLAQQAIALEAARMADRLDALNAAIESDGVIHLMHFRLRDLSEDEGIATVVVTVDGVLGEARQTAAAFERVLRAAKAGANIAAPKSGGGTVADELKAKRESGERGRRVPSSPAAPRRAAPKSP